MSALTKTIASVVALGVLAPSIAFAQTSTTSASALVNQIQTYQTQIKALQQQQQQALAALVSTLKQGSAGDQVLVLQALLAADPSIYPEGIVSGFFGKLTAEAVKRFQKKNGLEQVGNVGPKTLKKLQNLLEENPLALTIGTSTATSTNDRGEGKRPCAIVPPGHLIAPGFLKKHEGEDKPIVPPCQNLPQGIKDKLENGWHQGSSTPSGTTTPPVVDTTDPIISSVSVGSIGSTSAVVSWSTNENADAKLYYSPTSPVNLATSLTLVNGSLTMSHGFVVSALTASTTYYYVLQSSDAAHNVATTTEASFSTLP